MEKDASRWSAAKPADEATLDVVKFLGRRIQLTTTLLILSYRDDEVSSKHPLHFLLGDFSSHLSVRLFGAPPITVIVGQEVHVSLLKALSLLGPGRERVVRVPRARGVEIWAALRSLGRAGLADMIERNCRYAARFAAGLTAAGYEVLNDVQLNQVLVPFGDPEKTRWVIESIQRDGACWCGGTIWQGRTAMRISVSSWATTAADVEKSLDATLHLAARH